MLPLPPEKQFTIRRPSSCTRRCSVRLAPIAENSSLLPPVGVWAVLNPSVAARPLRPATDRRLGERLPHQLANRPQAQLPAPSKKSFACRGLPPQAHAVLSAISRRYSSLKGRYPCVTHPSATPWLTEVSQGVRLACVRHAASVYPEPGSNSPSKASIATPACTGATCLEVSDPGQVLACVVSYLACSQIAFVH